MNHLLFLLSQIALAPYRLVTGLLDAPNEMFHGSRRGRSLILGLPALIVAGIGISALVWAFNGDRNQLQSRYNSEVRDILAEREKAKRALQVMLQTSDPDDEERAAELAKAEREYRELTEKSQIFLNKLIALNPSSYLYRFQLATASIEPGQPETINRAVALMQSIAPDDEPVFADAHLWLANYYRTLITATSDPTLRRQFYELALKHVEFCLVRESTNPVALDLEASLLFADRRYDEAYTNYEELFKQDPAYHDKLYQINELLLKSRPSEKTAIENRQQVVLENARAEYLKLLRSSVPTAENDPWKQYLREYVNVLLRMGRYETAVEELEKEERLYREKLTELDGSDDRGLDGARHLAVRGLLVEVYLAQIAEMDDGRSPEQIQKDDASGEMLRNQLEILNKALILNPNNSLVLRAITELANSDTPIAADARRLYDPFNDPNAPASVLNELGAKALNEAKYGEAIEYFEQALRLNRDDGPLKNNLAYAYLLCEDRQPDRAYQLVQEAIRDLPKVRDPGIRASYSSFYHDTLGNALLQLERPGDAVVAFEIALRERPKNEKILKGLITAYERLGNAEQAAIFQKRLDEVQRETPSPGGSG